MLIHTGETNLIFCTTALFDNGCVAEACKVFALVSHDNLIKQVVLKPNKIWLSRELCLSWLIDCSTVLHFSVYSAYIIKQRAIISCCRVFKNDKHAVAFEATQWPQKLLSDISTPLVFSHSYVLSCNIFFCRVFISLQMTLTMTASKILEEWGGGNCVWKQAPFLLPWE